MFPIIHDVWLDYFILSFIGAIRKVFLVSFNDQSFCCLLYVCISLSQLTGKIICYGNYYGVKQKKREEEGYPGKAL